MRITSKWLLAAAALSSLAFSVLPAQADVVVDVVPWLAPNFFGSPSWNAAVTNAVQGMENGGVATGTGPSAFIPNSNVTAAQGIVTGFPSWMGQANPGAVFGPAYASELGNRMTFALAVFGNGQQFSISQLSFNAISSDPGNGLGFGFGAGSYSYSADYVGVINGPGGPTFITSGPSTQLVDEIFGRGSGNSYAAYCDPCTLAQQAEQAIDAAAAGAPYTFKGTYSIDGADGSGTFNVSAVPELQTWAMMLLGFCGLGLIGYRRKDRVIA